MNLVEDKQRGLIPPGLQSWPLQLIEHLTNITSVAPPPAGPAGCCPLYLLHLSNLSFTIWAPNSCCILQFRAYWVKVVYATALVLLGAKAKFQRRKPKVLVPFDEISEICRPKSMFSVVVIPRYFAD